MNIRTSIFRILQQSTDALTLAQISRKIASSRQAISYQLTQMVDKGIVLKKGIYYELQPFLHNPEIENELLRFFAQRLQDCSLTIPKTCEIESNDIIHAGIALFCEAFLDEIREIVPVSKPF